MSTPNVSRIELPWVNQLYVEGMVAVWTYLWGYLQSNESFFSEKSVLMQEDANTE